MRPIANKGSNKRRSSECEDDHLVFQPLRKSARIHERGQQFICTYLLQDN